MERKLDVAAILCDELSSRASEIPEEDPATVLFALRGIKYFKLAGEDVESLVALLRGRGNHEHAVLIDFLQGLHLQDIEAAIQNLEVRLNAGQGLAS